MSAECAPRLLPSIKLRKGQKKVPSLGDKLLVIRALPNAKDRDKAFGNFILSAQGFLRKCCRWYVGDDLDNDDLMADATEAFWTAMLDWDSSGAPFDTHARWRIRTYLGRTLRGSRLVRGKKPEHFDSIDNYHDEDARQGALPDSLWVEPKIEVEFEKRKRK